MEPTMDFRYVDLKDIDPNFTLLDGPEFYNLRITKAEFSSYTAKKETKTQQVGDEVTTVKLALTVVDHPKFTGRKLWETLYPGEFSFKVCRRIEDATGVQQTGSLEDWLKELSNVQPVIKVQVDQIPDTIGNPPQPNPKTVKPDGTPGLKNIVAWRAGVQPE